MVLPAPVGGSPARRARSGRTAGNKVGKVRQVYLDDTTGRPEWVTVKTGLFGTEQSFVPLAASRVEGDQIVVDATEDPAAARH